jgi:hypothetical protein
MRYKNNVLDRLTQTEVAINRVTLEVNRNMTREQILESVEKIKENIEGIREMISIEPDDFDQQFRPQ